VEDRSTVEDRLPRNSCRQVILITLHYKLFTVAKVKNCKDH